jgi:cell division protein FtsB
MDSDRQDFLERQEARRQRKQQRMGQDRQNASSAHAPPPSKSGDAEAKRLPEDQAQAAVRGKTGPGKAAGRSANERSSAPSKAASAPRRAAASAANSAAQAKGKPKAGGQAASRPQAAASSLASTEERSLAGGLEGRRTASRREELAGAAAASRDPKPSLLARTIIWTTAALCGLLILATIGEVWTVHRLNQQVTASQQTANQLQSQNQAIATSIQQLQQPGTIEQEARKLGYIYPGDQPVVIVSSSPTSAPPQKAAAPTPGWWGFWPDWLKLFFGG